MNEEDKKRFIETKCPDCGSEDFIKKGEEVICSKCGLVVQD